MHIVGYGCSSAAGPNSAAFWQALCAGESGLTSGPLSLPQPLLKPPSMRQRLLKRLQQAWDELSAKLSADQLAAVREPAALGVIFASTKGGIDDFIWSAASSDNHAALTHDPYSDLLRQFLRQSDIGAHLTLTVSNACASSLVALWLAEQWLVHKRVRYVLLLAADGAGPFVLHGFHSLHLLSVSTTRPFAANRDGMHLGEAGAAVLLGGDEPTAWRIAATGMDCEGHAFTRPQESGASLRRAACMLGKAPPDLIIAHGTATAINDVVEDQVYHEISQQRNWQPVPITASKWCIGHTLGASGAMDLIAGCEAIAHQRAYRMASSAVIDAGFHGQYLFGKSSAPLDMQLRRVWIGSLGFGGVHAMTCLEKG